jgi:hypothetical protein
MSTAGQPGATGAQCCWCPQARHPQCHPPFFPTSSECTPQTTDKESEGPPGSSSHPGLHIAPMLGEAEVSWHRASPGAQFPNSGFPASPLPAPVPRPLGCPAASHRYYPLNYLSTSATTLSNREGQDEASKVPVHRTDGDTLTPMNSQKVSAFLTCAPGLTLGSALLQNPRERSAGEVDVMGVTGTWSHSHSSYSLVHTTSQRG